MPQETSLNHKDFNHHRFIFRLFGLLTFFGSITGIVFNSIGYFNAVPIVKRISSESSDSQLNVMHYSDGNLGSPIESFGNVKEQNYKKFSVVGVLAYLLCLVGAVLIFQGKIGGFYSLVIGVFFNLISHLLFFDDNFGAMSISMLAAFFGLLIVVLFWLHLKYLLDAIYQFHPYY